MKTKTIDEIFDNPENFESLLGMCLLFDKNSKYFEYSGFITAALLDRENDGNNKLSILAIDTHKPNGWYTFKWKNEDLKEMLSNCIEFVGKTEEDSFVLK